MNKIQTFISSNTLSEPFFLTERIAWDIHRANMYDIEERVPFSTDIIEDQCLDLHFGEIDSSDLPALQKFFKDQLLNNIQWIITPSPPLKVIATLTILFEDVAIQHSYNSPQQ